MRPILLMFFIALIFHSCKPIKKKEDKMEFDTIETQMAEIKARPRPEIEVSKKDSSEFLKFWDSFYKNYKKNNTTELIRLSFDSVNSPVFDLKENRFQQKSRFISISDFLNSQVWNNTPIKPYGYTKSDQSFIMYTYEYNKDTIIKKTNQENIILTYRVLVESKKIKENYEFRNLFVLTFTRKNKSIRFSGMEINGESYPRLVNDSATRSKLYFPLYRESQSKSANSNALDTFVNLWYSNVLSEFKEPNLYTYSGEDNIYRFTWLRSFHNPVVIRFQKHGDEYNLVTKEMIDNQGYIPNEFVVNTNRSLSVLSWYNWEVKLGRSNFWNRVALDPESRPNDGADWILEAKVNARYHFVSRYSYDADFNECCRHLIRLSKLKIREENIY